MKLSLVVAGLRLILHCVSLHISTSRHNSGPDIAGGDGSNYDIGADECMPSPLASWDFDEGAEGWTFAGTIPPYDTPATMVDNNLLGLSPRGSAHCFSYWQSPEVMINTEKNYRALWDISSNAETPDESVAFRLRAYNTDSRFSWSTIVNSINNPAPGGVSSKVYNLVITPPNGLNPLSKGQESLVLTFDIMSFVHSDDTNSWIYADSVVLEDISIAHSGTPVYEADFDADTQGWQFADTIPGYDTPVIYNSGEGYLTLSANGSAHCFSYWGSEDITVNNDTVYIVNYTMVTTVNDPANSLDFRRALH